MADRHISSAHLPNGLVVHDRDLDETPTHGWRRLEVETVGARVRLLGRSFRGEFCILASMSRADAAHLARVLLNTGVATGWPEGLLSDDDALGLARGR